ncbi:MAG TPA: DUF255 domain-containing protein [Methylomirabilota bacterium]|nr:DUF255 domain-containing protein [Methylomirabilota bacterium]
MIRFSPNPHRADLIRWLEWEEEAFQKAREEDKPVMLFLGAFWCRYCQRMDEEAFSDRENRALLNAYFVALRIENAKRPDIDARYNLNGWPTIAFLTPNGKLLAAANYLPAEEFKEVLLNVYLSYEEERAKAGAPVRTEENRSEATHPGAGRQHPESALAQITDAIMALADRANGGFGAGQKFINADATEFLLARYEAARDPVYLDHVCLTLDRMREGAIYDEKDGGYFRTTTGADWSRPHREKLLAEQAGMLANSVGAFRLTGRGQYARMAEEIIDYLDRKLFDPASGAFFGCEDFLKRERPEEPGSGELFSIIDRCIYTDANARLACAYLDAAAILDRLDCKARALGVLNFLWRFNRSEQDGMFHYSDGAPHAPGLLIDQAQMGLALVRAFQATGEAQFLERSSELAELIRHRLTNPAGGYYDRGESALGFFGARLTLIDQNGVAALFFLKLAEATKEASHRAAALWALNSFSADFNSQGIHAAPFGRALCKLRELE